MPGALLSLSENRKDLTLFSVIGLTRPSFSKLVTCGSAVSSRKFLCLPESVDSLCSHRARCRSLLFAFGLPFAFCASSLPLCFQPSGLL